MKLTSALETHIGRRANNEDSACNEPKLGLYAVADGMGGYEGGEVASDIAIQTLRSFVRNNRSDRDCTWPYKLDLNHSLEENLLLTGTRIAHDQIEVKRVGKLNSMGSTLVAMLTSGNQAILVNVGDSRIYRIRAGKIEQLTRDHSLYEELRASGTELPPREDFVHGNVITRALGLQGNADARTVTMQPDDLYILCSDGLSDVIGDAGILAEARECSEPQALTDRLVQLAYDKGGRDNITVLVVGCATSEDRAS
jgi:serine/threonine protein phosphatase PrpC